jgi:hypothetical protein
MQVHCTVLNDWKYLIRHRRGAGNLAYYSDRAGLAEPDPTGYVQVTLEVLKYPILPHDYSAIMTLASVTCGQSCEHTLF